MSFAQCRDAAAVAAQGRASLSTLRAEHEHERQRWQRERLAMEERVRRETEERVRQETEERVRREMEERMQRILFLRPSICARSGRQEPNSYVRCDRTDDPRI